MVLGASSATKTNAKEEEKADSSLLLKNYLKALETLVKERDSLNTSTATSAPNAYYYQILSQPALYSSSIHQMLGQTDLSSSDQQLQRLFASRKMLSSLYTGAPQLVRQTESDITGQAAIRGDINDRLTAADKLADKVAAASLVPELDGPVEVITRRPNFWKFSGTTSLQFAQNYISDNWYNLGEHAGCATGFPNDGDRRKAHFPTEPQPSSLHWQCRLQGLEELVLLSTGHSADPDCTQLSEKHR